MKLFRELLLEAADSKLAEKLKAIYDGLTQRQMDAAKDALDLLEKASSEDKIFNVEYNEIKNTLSSCLEKVLTLHHHFSRDEKDWDKSPHMMVYQADINTYVYLNQAKGQAKKIRDFMAAHKDFPADDKAKLEKMLAANEAAEQVFVMLTKLKPKIVKGRRPSENVDPNKFHSKLGSAEAQKIVKDKLEEGIKKPLDDYEKAVKDWLQSIIDSIGDTYTQMADRHQRDPMKDMIFYQVFDSEKDYQASDKEKTVYKNVKIRKKDYAASEAKHQRDMIEKKYLAKNIKKLSHVVDLKGNLSSISELPYKKPAIKGGGGQLESGFIFEFADSSEFKVINKIVTKYSYAGKQFEQFPTTFHDVKFPDGTKMKIPSEEKMVKEFGEWKPK